MKILFYTVLALLTLSCASKKELHGGKATIANECPHAGNCSVEILNNKALVSTVDPIGKSAYKTSDTVGSRIIRYVYEKKKTPLTKMISTVRK